MNEAASRTGWMGYVILLGMMGCGKSTVGRLLADALGVPFRDTDQILEYRLGRMIPQIFELYGEDAFRHHETSVLRGLDVEGGVLATGGGIVLKDENWVEFSRLGVTVFLDVKPERLIERLSASGRKRPLLSSEDWEERLRSIYAARRPLYERADFRVEIDQDEMETVAERVLKAVQG